MKKENKSGAENHIHQPHDKLVKKLLSKNSLCTLISSNKNCKKERHFKLLRLENSGKTKSSSNINKSNAVLNAEVNSLDQ